ncbi:MAG: aryl-sulfate sulfotransferase [Dehalococcoidia bacterium]
MGWSTHHPIGLIYYAPQNAYLGYTLVATNRGGTFANLIDMEGRVCHRWHWEGGIVYGYLLPNGHLLFRSSAPQEGGTASFGGSSASLVELDWEGNEVWSYHDPTLHHDFERLPNGNTLALLWEALDPELVAQVRGGFTTEEDDPILMYGDVVREITPSGDVVWEWNSWEQFSPAEEVICPLERRREWSHQNALNLTPEGDLLVSYRQISTVGIVDRASGKFKWKWGPGEVYHQHHPTYLNNGRIMIFDNGAHRREGASFSRIIEVDPTTNQIGWEYQSNPNIAFYSHNISSAERQPNGNTLICEGAAGRIFEVTPQKEIVWEYINPFFGQAQAGTGNSVNNVFRSHRYGPDHPALKGKDLDPARYASLNRLYAGG